MMVLCNDVIEYDRRRLRLPNTLVDMEHDNNRTQQ